MTREGYTATADWRLAGYHQDQLRRPLLLSLLGHIGLAGLGLLGMWRVRNEVVWGEGGPGGAATVTLVSKASVPLPAPTVATDNRVANENRGLHYPEAPKPEAAKKAAVAKPTINEKAIELPSRRAKRTVASTARPQTAEPTPAPRPQARLRKATPAVVPSNEIPYGEGGPAQGPYGVFSTDAGTGGIQVSGGSGDFGTRYGWYVTAIRNRISANWLKSTVDPGIRAAPRVYASFQILRDGQVVNSQLTASSGIPSLDRSALRAVLDSNPMPQLPADYSGSNITVEFWFDFRR